MKFKKMKQLTWKNSNTLEYFSTDLRKLFRHGDIDDRTNVQERNKRFFFCFQVSNTAISYYFMLRTLEEQDSNH